MSLKDPFLLGLFREEMAVHSAVLTDGLLSLERHGTRLEPHATEPLMRAAHSLKGAARVVDLGEVSRVAHRMEDVFVAMGEGRVGASPELTDALLSALDWMVSVADVPDDQIETWLEVHAPEAESWESRLGDWLHVAATPPVVASHNSFEFAEAEASSPLPPGTGLGVASSAEKLESPREDSSVRISSENLGQMLAHSADLLLEARRLDALARDARLMTRRIRGFGTLHAEGEDRPEVRAIWSEVGTLLEQQDDHFLELSSRLNFLSERMHALVLRGRLRPFSEGTQGFPRLVRDLAKELRKSVEFRLLGGTTLIDRDILSRLDAPLNHLLRNALDHGIETPEARIQAGKPAEGLVTLEARHQSGRLLITLSDDGRGIDVLRLREKIVERQFVTEEMAAQLTDQELYAFLFLPGLTTCEEVSQISGRGVGLDVVQTMVHGCGGSLQVFSEQGSGTRFECFLPITRSVIRCLRVEIGGEGYALPLSRIDRAERIHPDHCMMGERGLCFNSEWGEIPIISGHDLWAVSSAMTPAPDHSLVLLGGEDRRYALEVDRLSGEVDLVVRPLDARLGSLAHFSAVSIDSEGRPILILDVDDLLDAFDRRTGKERDTRSLVLPQQDQPGHHRILVVDDSLTVREVERRLFEEAGYEVETAVDGIDGWNQLNLSSYALVVTDVDMPRMNGIELVSRIRADERFLSLPVVIVSYKDREEDRELGILVGADEYLTKGSFHDRGLLDVVDRLINQGRMLP